MILDAITKTVKHKYRFWSISERSIRVGEHVNYASVSLWRFFKKLNRLSEILSPSFLNSLLDLIFLGVATCIFFIMGALFEPSLGLVAFSLLLWVTLPWAFLDQLTPTKIRQKYPEVSEENVKRSKDWLGEGANGFLLAGIVFLLSAFTDLASPTLEHVNPNLSFLIFYSSIAPIILFILGMSVLSFAVFRTHQVINFLFNPVSFRKIERFPTTYARFLTRILEFGILIPFWLFDILSCFLFLYITVVSFSLIWFILLISFGAGSCGIFLIWKMPLSRGEKPLSRRDAIAPIIILFPYLIYFFFIVGKIL